MSTIFITASVPSAANTTSDSPKEVKFQDFPLKDINDKTAIDAALKSLSQQGFELMLGHVTEDNLVVATVIKDGRIRYNPK